jgi:hypothetical protein
MMDVAFAVRLDSCFTGDENWQATKSKATKKSKETKHVDLAIAPGVRHRERSGLRSRCPKRHATFAVGGGRRAWDG